MKTDDGCSHHAVVDPVDSTPDDPAEKYREPEMVKVRASHRQHGDRETGGKATGGERRTSKPGITMFLNQVAQLQTQSEREG